MVAQPRERLRPLACTRYRAGFLRVTEGVSASVARALAKDCRKPSIDSLSVATCSERRLVSACCAAISRFMVADSPDEVRVRAREQLMQGASQVKLTAGGGVASPFSPLDVSTFTEPELRAAVEAADNWGTYVATHAYTPVAIQRSIAAGVRCIEHGHLMAKAWIEAAPAPSRRRQRHCLRRQAGSGPQSLGPTRDSPDSAA